MNSDRPRALTLCLTLCLAVAASSPGLSQTPKVPAPAPLSASDWRADLAYLVDTLERVHPDLYARVDRATFRTRAEELAAAIPGLSDPEIVVRLMQLVAQVEDGHTSLEPSDRFGFGRWFPVRFYRFADGIFITAVADRYAELAGARVLRIGDLPAERAWDLTATLLGGDNELAILHRAPLYLSNAEALRILGINGDADRLELDVRLADGRAITTALDAVDAGHDLSFQFWGEIWGPASEKVTYVTPFGPTDGHFGQSTDLPLHLRQRAAFSYSYLPDEKLFYAQINYLGDSGRIGQTFAEFSQALWSAADAAEVDRFVLDIRYNIGGDGSLVLPFVHEIIKRDGINRKGTLFTLVGRATFSAGVMMARSLEEHTETTFAGEPAGAYWKHYGDGTSFELPESGLVVWVSTIYHQLSSYAGNQRMLGIELPAPFSSADWLGGRDPALEAIRSAADRPLIANIFRQQGAAAALEAYDRRSAEYGGVDWWEPFTLESLNSLGHELLDADRYEDALAAYRLNARRHPDHWRVWYSLGRAQRRHGDLEAAIESYEKALAVDPFNNLAPYQRQGIEEMRSASPEAP